MSEPESKLTKPSKIVFLVALIVGLLAWGLPMIGVAVNLPFGAIVLAAAFGLIVYLFWIWERSSKWHRALRVVTVVVVAGIYFFLISRQMLLQYRKDHPSVVAFVPTPTPNRMTTATTTQIPMPSFVPTPTPSKSVKPWATHQKVNDQLGMFVLEGEQTKDQFAFRLCATGISDEVIGKYMSDVAAWDHRIKLYLEKPPLGVPYLARFTHQVNPHWTYPCQFSKSNYYGVWNLLISDLEKLDEFIREPATNHMETPHSAAAGIEKSGINISAPNGIAIGGGNVTNPTVNNFAPPQRMLTDDQRKRFVALLKPHCPFEIALRHVPGNVESQTYADQIGDALKEAGCSLRRPRFLIDVHNGLGMFVSLHDIKNIPPNADALVGAFREAGIPVKSSTTDAIEEGVIYIFVELSDSNQP